MSTTIEIERANQPEVLALMAESDAYYAALYPAESNHLTDVETLDDGVTTFLVARIAGAVRGFGALLPQNGYGEIKRMFVAPEARGQRLGATLLAALETKARAIALPALRLETGIKQREAIKLYRTAGFVEIAPFGTYRPDPLSIFMEKTLIA